ncbi:hypothetical protein GALL_411000 [mine drainage metagenome]|uniref:Uncharacterized protein n=1 Tax=mine drainage metagenome TaxID=410659 RepID=A0A1J5QMG8_9ZZZZ
MDSEALDFALWWRDKRPEPQSEMLYLLGSGLRAPDPIPLHAEGGEGRRLEAEKFGHLVIQSFVRHYDARLLRRPRGRRLANRPRGTAEANRIALTNGSRLIPAIIRGPSDYHRADPVQDFRLLLAWPAVEVFG